MVAWISLGVFFLCDVALVGWLIFRTLSQREVDRVLLEAQSEARELAQRIADRPELAEEDLYLIITYQSDIQRYIDDELAERELVESVRVFDKSGSLVFQSREAKPGLDEGSGGTRITLPEELPGLPPDLSESDYEVREPIGDLGWLRIGISPRQLAERTAVLRQDLIERLVWIVIVSLLVLVSAYAIIWLLLVRARRLEEQKEEADRLAYIGTLAAGLAHEIRNPLNSLNLNMQMLGEELGEQARSATGKRLLDITSNEISRLERLATDFLSYARPRPLELERVAPAEVFTHARDVLAAEIVARGARVEIEDRSGDAEVAVDEGQMNQLFLNLLQNALAATEGCGRDPKIRLLARREGAKVVLTVEDNGVGIAKEDQQRIFDIFYSTRKGGTGLGLAVVQRIARDHGGELSLESRPGRGTRISFTLPAASESEATALRPEPRPA